MMHWKRLAIPGGASNGTNSIIFHGDIRKIPTINSQSKISNNSRHSEADNFSEWPIYIPFI